MCGFVAIFTPKGSSSSPILLDRMTDALAHRGPDGRGTFRVEQCALGHRRLSIIDLEGGAQPLFGLDERLAIVFNGEIYNYREVRAQLGEPWRTKSDTEVFLRVYELYGVQGLSRLTGMWGAAIWDGRTRELVVVRDRIGKKPVYYAELAGGGAAFASEIRSLLLHPEVSDELDPSALHPLLTYRYLPAPRTMLKGVKKLLPGTAARVSDRGLVFERYWHPIPKVRRRSDADAEAEFLAAFDRSVELRMVSDVPVGIFLSGGIDSAAVLHSMRREGVHAFTVAFSGGAADDETLAAQETARLYHAQHHTLTIGPSDYADYLDHYARQLEEPVLNDSAIATHFLSKLARSFVKVVLSGQGADEPLAGYDRYKGEWLSGYYRHLPMIRALEPALLRVVREERVQRALRSLHEPDDIRRALLIYAVLHQDEKAALLRPEFGPSEPIEAPIESLHREVPNLSPLGRMLYTDTRMWLVDDLLLVADKLSMAHGLELRVPFLDHQLIELIESMPDDQKLRLGRHGFETKRVHRAAMRTRLPQSILRRKKRGFTNPMDAWLKRELKPLVEERLLTPTARVNSWLRPEAVRRLFEEHVTGRRDRRRVLFLLLTLETWLHSFWEARPARLADESTPTMEHRAASLH